MKTLKYPTETKAIKDHVCSFCNLKIRKGETYKNSTHIYEGSIYDWKSHTNCNYLATRLNMFEDADEGVTQDMFMEYVGNAHDDLLIEKLPQENIKQYSDIIQQIRYVQWAQKLGYVLRYFLKLDKELDLDKPF